MTTQENITPPAASPCVSIMAIREPPACCTRTGRSPRTGARFP